jgi:hypothetical protein
VLDQRGRSPVPTSRKGGRQRELTEITADQIRRNDLANRIRDHVAVWRGAGYPNGGTDPYQRLRRALRADIDEQAWASV